MKKILLSSIVLFIFSIAMLTFQLSCNKKASASPSTDNSTNTQLNKIVFVQYDYTGHYGDIYTANYDGTNKTKVNLTMGQPNPQFYDVTVSPDDKKLFFRCAFSNAGTITEDIYSANIDGTNVQKIITGGPSVSFGLGNAY